MTRLSILCFFTFLQLTACTVSENPEFRELKNVKFKSISFSNGPSATFNADAVFFNPNDVGANVTEVDLDFYIDGKKVTNINQNVSAEMNAKSEFVLPLNFEVSLKDIFKDGKSALGSVLKSRKIKYRVDGTLKVGLGSVEFAVPVDYEGEEAIKL